MCGLVLANKFCTHIENLHTQFGYTMTYTFLGDVEYVKSDGQKPMNIEWRLKEPIPPYLLRESRKLSTG